MIKFSPRETQVIEHLIDGGTRKSFAEQHSIKKPTVTAYIMRAKEKADAANVGQLCVIYWRESNKTARV